MAKGEVTVKVNVEMSDDAKELIRKIVREEIAAQQERLRKDDDLLGQPSYRDYLYKT